MEDLVSRLETEQQPHVLQYTGLPPKAYQRVRNAMWITINDPGSRTAAEATLEGDAELSAFTRDMVTDEQAAFIRETLKRWNVIFTKYETPHTIYLLLRTLYNIFPGGSHIFTDNRCLVGTNYSYHPNASIRTSGDTTSLIVNSELIISLFGISFDFSDILLSEQMATDTRIKDISGLWSPLHINGDVAQDAVNSSGRTSRILYHALLRCALADRYTVGRHISADRSNLARQIFSGALTFVMAHECGHYVSGYVEGSKRVPVNYAFEESALFKTIFDRVRLANSCDGLTRGQGDLAVANYLNTSYPANMRELDADLFGVHACLHWQWFLGEDPYTSYLGMTIALSVLDWIDRLMFVEEHGFDYRDIINQPFITEIVFPREHPYGLTRVFLNTGLIAYLSSIYSALGEVNSDGVKFDDWYQHREFLQIHEGVHELLKPARHLTALEALKRRASDEEELVALDNEGNVFASKTFKGRGLMGWRA